MNSTKRSWHLWTRFKYYIYMPYWRWIWFPSLKLGKYLGYKWRLFEAKLIRIIWWIIDIISQSPGKFQLFLINISTRIWVWFTSKSWLQFFLKNLNKILKIYFYFVNLRRVLIIFVFSDYWYLNWTSQPIEVDLRVWNMCALVILFNFLYAIMDSADWNVRPFTHDIFTKFYIKFILNTWLHN